MLAKLDPTMEAWSDPTHEVDPDLLPVYTQCKAVAAYLPGKYIPVGAGRFCRHMTSMALKVPAAKLIIPAPNLEPIGLEGL